MDPDRVKAVMSQQTWYLSSGNGNSGGGRPIRKVVSAATIDNELTGPFAQEPFIKTVEWEMLDKRKYFPMSMLSSFTVRCLLYPLTLIRTRLQVQQRNDLYSGTFDAFRKVVQKEGVSGLYRGFLVSSFQVVSGLFYVTTYEGVRHALEVFNVTNSDKMKAFIGGSAASVVGQTIIVPFDVISQHMMLVGCARQVSRSGHGGNASSHFNPLKLQLNQHGSTASLAWDITRTIYRKDGCRGFYRGYLASLFTYVPNSASWWTFYHWFQECFWLAIPATGVCVPHMAVQCAAALSAGCASSLLTNPLDLIRARVQVHRHSLPQTAMQLWRDERMAIFVKGLTARMSSSVIYSVAIIFGYETVKRWSVRDEYKHRVLW